MAQARGLSPHVLIDLLAHLGPQLDAHWASLDLAVIGGNDVWWAAPDVPAPVWLHIARECTECWVHQQQIRDAVGRPGADEPELVQPVIDTFLRALPRTLRDVPADPGMALRITVEGSAGGTWTVTRDETAWSMADDPDPGRMTLLRLDAGTVWLATGGITPEVAGAAIRLDGDEVLGNAALTIVAIIR